MNRKQKIQQLLDRLDELQAQNPVGSVERLLTEEQQKARDSVGETPTGTALKVLARGLEKVQADRTPDRILTTLEQANEENSARFDELTSTFSSHIQSLLDEVQAVDTRGQELTKSEVESILSRFAEYQGTYETDRTAFSSKDALLEGEVNRILIEIENIYGKIASIPDHTPRIEQNITEVTNTIVRSNEDTQKLLKELEQRVNQRINQIQNNGGNQNRNIAIGGNVNALSPFTDVNLKAGAGTIITFVANQTTKYMDVTITATGSGSGITRQVNSIAVDTNGDGTAGIDQVYLCTAGLTLTLPTAVGNTNLYTVKNTGVGTVIIATTGGQTIDGDTTVTMPTQFTSVDLISNGSNWSIT